MLVAMARNKERETRHWGSDQTRSEETDGRESSWRTWRARLTSGVRANPIDFHPAVPVRRASEHTESSVWLLRDATRLDATTQERPQSTSSAALFSCSSNSRTRSRGVGDIPRATGSAVAASRSSARRLAVPPPRMLPRSPIAFCYGGGGRECKLTSASGNDHPSKSARKVAFVRGVGSE